VSTRDIFLREHASVHTHEVGGSPYGLDWLFPGLDETAWRTRPHGLNSLAWLLWHMASVEDTHVAPVVFGETPLLNGALAKRLGVDVRRTYRASQDVDLLSRSVDVKELLAYRDAVGRRTRALASALPEARWTEPLAEVDLQRGAQAGHLTGQETYLVGTPRDALLFWWGVAHSHYHIGQAAMLRTALGIPVRGGE
jgi:hypothetical protein